MLNKLYDNVTPEDVCVNCKNKNDNNTCKLDNHNITQEECFNKCKNFEKKSPWIEGEAFVKCRFCGYVGTIDLKGTSHCPNCGN